MRAGRAGQCRPQKASRLQCRQCRAWDAGIAGSWSLKSESEGCSLHCKWRLGGRGVAGETESPSKGIASLRRLRFTSPKDRRRVCPAMAHGRESEGGRHPSSANGPRWDGDPLAQKARNAGIAGPRPAVPCRGNAGLQPASPPAITLWGSLRPAMTATPAAMQPACRVCGLQCPHCRGVIPTPRSVGVPSFPLHMQSFFPFRCLTRQGPGHGVGASTGRQAVTDTREVLARPRTVCRRR